MKAIVTVEFESFGDLTTALYETIRAIKAHAKAQLPDKKVLDRSLAGPVPFELDGDNCYGSFEIIVTDDEAPPTPAPEVGESQHCTVDHPCISCRSGNEKVEVKDSPVEQPKQIGYRCIKSYHAAMDWDFKKGDISTSDQCSKLPLLWEPTYEAGTIEQPAHVSDISLTMDKLIDWIYDECQKDPWSAGSIRTWIEKYCSSQMRGHTAIPYTKGEIPEDLMLEIGAAYASLPTVQQMGMGLKGWMGGACYMCRKMWPMIEKQNLAILGHIAKRQNLEAQIASLTQQREERDEALVAFRKEIVSLTQQRDTAVENLGKMIDVSKAKSDEAAEYRTALEAIKVKVLEYQVTERDSPAANQCYIIANGTLAKYRNA